MFVRLFEASAGPLHTVAQAVHCTTLAGAIHGAILAKMLILPPGTEWGTVRPCPSFQKTMFNLEE
jgi:hypothetical protein